jgi:hypothetical protein
VITLRSNCRWRSDQLEIRARDGGVVRVLFDVDACEAKSSSVRQSPMAAAPAR